MRHEDAVPDPAVEDNILRVRLREGVPFPEREVRRGVEASSSCGVCGRASVENLVRALPKLPLGETVSVGLLYGLPSVMRGAQSLFGATGGSHAAAHFDLAGQLRVMREDVGRHNAVDKVCGWGLLQPEPVVGGVLLVSGRASFEIVQKAAVAGIPIVAAISAPTSLSVALARALNITLVGFLREKGLNVYAGEERVIA
jgi:FdhD protein